MSVIGLMWRLINSFGAGRIYDCETEVLLFYSIHFNFSSQQITLLVIFLEFKAENA